MLRFPSNDTAAIPDEVDQTMCYRPGIQNVLLLVARYCWHKWISK